MMKNYIEKNEKRLAREEGLAEGRAEEKLNTLRERQRADEAEAKLVEMLKEKDEIIAKLQAELKKKS